LIITIHIQHFSYDKTTTTTQINIVIKMQINIGQLVNK
jgi:hypothetical protein